MSQYCAQNEFDEMIFKFFKWKLVSSTQQLILLTLFIIRPVSSDQTDFIRDSDKMSKGN